MSYESDPAWAYCCLVDYEDTIMCNFCQKIMKEGISVAKHHFVGGFKNMKACTKCPPEVRNEMAELMMQKRKNREDRSMASFDNELDFDGRDDDEMESDDNSKRKRKQVASGGSSHLPKKPRHKGPLDVFFTQDPENVVAKQKGRKTKIGESGAAKKELRARVCQTFVRWMCDVGLPFNVVKYDSFKAFVKAVGQAGPGVKPPSYHEVRVSLLKQEVETIRGNLKEHEKEWARYGCSIMSDRLKDSRERTFINFLVNSPKGSVFIESVDASSYAKTGDKMFELLSKFVDKIGEQNVVQVVTDSTSNNIKAGKLLEAKYPNLFWMPCAAHCLDLILEDIFKLKNLKKTFERAIMLNSYIYTRPGVLNMLRKFTKKQLLRPAKTRFATAFITLSRIHEQKNNLRNMFISEEWKSSKWTKEAMAKKVQEVIFMPSFWNNVVFALKVSDPLIRVLRLVDGEKPPMGFIYKAMDSAKEAIAKSFTGDESRYKDVFKIIDARWNIQLDRPLHAAGWYLNQQFFYPAKAQEQIHEKVMVGLYQCIQRLVPDIETQNKIDDQLSKYRKAEGLFGNFLAIRRRADKQPADWWSAYGGSTPELTKFAIKVLSLTCSASGYEQNWSVFEHLHSKRRNRLDQSRLSDMVFVKYNRALRRRFQMRENIDPIYRDDIDDCNEWLTGRIDEEYVGDDELVKGKDGLTWDIVSRAAGVGECSYAFRSSESQANPLSTKRLNIRTMLFDDEDEDEIEEEEFEVEEEDGLKEAERDYEFGEDEDEDVHEDDEE